MFWLGRFPPVLVVEPKVNLCSSSEEKRGNKTKLPVSRDNFFLATLVCSKNYFTTNSHAFNLHISWDGGPTSMCSLSLEQYWVCYCPPLVKMLLAWVTDLEQVFLSEKQNILFEVRFLASD